MLHKVMSSLDWNPFSFLFFYVFLPILTSFSTYFFVLKFTLFPLPTHPKYTHTKPPLSYKRKTFNFLPFDTSKETLVFDYIRFLETESPFLHVPCAPTRYLLQVETGRVYGLNLCIRIRNDLHRDTWRTRLLFRKVDSRCSKLHFSVSLVSCL